MGMNLPEVPATPLSAFLTQRDLNQQYGLRDIQGVAGTVGILQHLQEQAAKQAAMQREGAWREKIAALGPNATTEQMMREGLTSGALNPKDATTLSAHFEENRLKRDANKEAIRSRLDFQMMQHEQKMELARRNATTAEDRAAVDAYDKSVRQAFARGRAQYDLPPDIADALPMPAPSALPALPQPRAPLAMPGMTPVSAPSVTVAPSVSMADVQGIADPQEQAQARAALQAGQYSAPQGAASQGVPTMPQRAVPAMPSATPPVGGLMPIANVVGNDAPTAPAPVAAPGVMPVSRRVMDRNAAKAQTGGGEPTLSAGAIDTASARYNMDGTLPANLGRGNQGAANIRAILDRAAEKQSAAGISGDDLRVSQMSVGALKTALGSLERQRANVMTYEKTALAGADIALEMSDKVDRTGMPILNKWIQAGQKNVLGDPDVSRLHNATETLTNEYAKVMSGSSGGQATTVSMQQHAREMLSAAHTKEQFKGVVDLMKREMTETREKAFDSQINEMKSRMSPPSKTEGQNRRASDQPGAVERSTSKSGKPMHKENGQWVYD